MLFAAIAVVPLLRYWPVIPIDCDAFECAWLTLNMLPTMLPWLNSAFHIKNIHQANCVNLPK